MLWKMPSILVGAKDLNKTLEDKGYKLFHNVIDYEFDCLNTMEQRIEVLIEQLQNIKDYKSAAEQMAETCEHNHRKFVNDIAYGYANLMLSVCKQNLHLMQKNSLL